MKGVNGKDNKSDPYDNSTNNSVVTMNANAVTSETQTSNSPDNAASFKNTQFPDNNQMPENPPSNSSADTSGSSTSHRATLQVVWAALTWMPTNPVSSRSMVERLRSMQAEMESTATAISI